jgi:hypothetical protein
MTDHTVKAFDADLAQLVRSQKRYRLAAAAIASSMLLLGCSTALLNENTIDLSTTVDDAPLVSSFE